MDEGNEGLLLIGTATVLFVFFLIAVLAVMLIYRRRKIQHVQEIDTINEKYHRELLQTQLEVQKETMQHIGREIHDNLGHQLTLAFLYLQSANQVNEAEKVSEIISQSLADLRSLSSNLINIDENAHDLSAVLERECEKLRSVRTCEVTFTGVSVVEVPKEVNNFILRVFQEFAQNSLKHSQCDTIHASLKEENQRLILRVSDDGVGFDMSDIRIEGTGLSNMKKRADMIGARFSIESELGTGTSMELVINLDKYSEQ
ncbi:MAG: ATP-binding protein [Bacteroidota bacterium]